MQSDGAREDDAELVVLHSQAANGIERLGCQLRAVVLADALQHVRHFVPEEREAIVACRLHQIFDGARQQLLPSAALEIHVIGLVFLEQAADEILRSFSRPKKLLHIVVDQFREFLSRVNLFQVAEDRLPTWAGLGQHLAKDLRFADSSFRVDHNALRFQTVPQHFDQCVSSVTLLWVEVSPGICFHVDFLQLGSDKLSIRQKRNTSIVTYLFFGLLLIV